MRRININISIALAAVSVFCIAGCFKDYCDHDGDCLSGEVCDPETHHCYAADAGDAGDASGLDGGDGGDAGDAAPDCTQSAQCTTPAAPICDATELVCRGCGTDGECAARDSALPVCGGSSCVECRDSVSHCANPAPICEAVPGQCRGCAGHGECASRDPALPACDGASCVECTDSSLHCGGSAPVCDPGTQQCRACADHGECAFSGGVCDWSTGACLAESAVIYADDDTCPQVGDGSRVTPYCSLQDAVDAVSAGRTTILVADGTYDRIDVVDTGVVWIVGEGPSVLILELSLSAQVYVTGVSEVTLENLTVGGTGSSGVGVECTGNLTTQPTLVLDNNTISGNAGGGVSATSCTATLSGNTISGNAGGGVSLTSSDFTLTNNIVVLNGSGTSSYGGVMIFLPGATAEFWHNTVADNTADTNPAGVRCVDPAQVHSSLLYGNDNADLSGSCTASFSWTTANGDPLLDGSYHLQAGSGCIDGGDPLGTLDHDIDGDPRPQGGGPDIGADEAQ